MKKLLSLVLVSMLLVSLLAGCSTSQNTQQSSSASTDSIVSTAATVASDTAASTADTTAASEKTETTAAQSTAAVTTTTAAATTESQEKTVIRLGGLKGPTSMGMVKLLDDDEQGKTVNDYEFTMAASADELTPKLLKGELDILAVPANLGSILYNKTNGAVQMLAVNMLGAIYIVEKNGNTVNSLADLKGKTIYATGKGSTPEYVLSYLLEQNGLELDKDVMVEWKSEPTETVAAMATQENAVAMLPQPFVTVASMQLENLRVAVDLYAEWEKLDNGSKFITAGLLVRKEFAEQNPEAIQAFLEEYAASTKFVKENVTESAALIEKYDIVKAAVAEKALPQCNIVCMTGEEMKNAVLGYFTVLSEQNADSIGGKLPEDDFFLIYG